MHGTPHTHRNPSRDVCLGALLAAAVGLLAHFSPAFAAAPGDIVINEIMQNPAAVSDASGEWFELFNKTSVPVSLEGWSLHGGGTENHTIAAGGTLVIPAGGYVVLARVADPATNGGLTPNYVYSSLTLGNGADTVVIRQAGVTIDSVAWDDGATFPDPDGASMELEDPLSNNLLGTNWSANTTTPYGAGDTGTPGAANANLTGSGTPPAVNNIQHVPNAPIETDTVHVRADVTDGQGILEVCTEYRIDGGSLTSIVMASVGGATYEAKIAPRPAGTFVEYLIVARDVDGHVTTMPAGAPAQAYSYTVGSFALTVSLNEALADPPTSSSDSTQGDVNRDGVGNSFADEFIEIVNYSSQPIDISGWTLSDDDAPGAEFTFPPGTVLPGGGFATLFGGGQPSGFTGLVFVDDGRIGNGLGNTGDTIQLKREGLIVDVLVFGTEAGNDESMIRVPDGTGAWTLPSLQGLDEPYTPQGPNGGGFVATESTTWGRVKSIFQ